MKIAINYLNDKELNILNCITTDYLEFALYQKRTKNELSQVEKDFIESLKNAKTN